MAFVKEGEYAAPQLPLKMEVLSLIDGFLDKFGIPKTRTVAKVYTVDLMQEFSKELAPISDAQMEEGLRYLVASASSILEARKR